MGKVSESIYCDGSVTIPMADVQHIEHWPKNSIPGIMVITKHTRWDFEHDIWSNPIWMSEPRATDFRRAWCTYRSELESETLADLTPLKNKMMADFDQAIDTLKRAGTDAEDIRDRRVALNSL